MLSDIDVLVLAAGKSSRISSVSKGLPKPLIPIQGRSILEHNLKWLFRYGVRSVWINLHFKADEIKEVIGTGEKLGLQIHYSYEPEILGTAGAYKNLEGEFPRTTLIVYGDNITSFNLDSFWETHHRLESEATIAVFDQNRHANTGIAGGRVIMDEHGSVLRFEEAGSTSVGHSSGEGFVNAGVYLLEPSIAGLIPPQTFCDFGKDIFPRMLKSHARLSGHVIDGNGYVLGLDQPENLKKGLHLIETGKVKLS